jgi:hypothetical protein
MELQKKDEAQFYSTAEILADDDIRSLQTKLIDAQNRNHYLQGRLDELRAAGGGGMGGGMGGGINPMMLMAMQGGMGGNSEGGEGSGMSKAAQLMLLQQNPAMGMMAGGKVDLANPTSMLGGLQVRKERRKEEKKEEKKKKEENSFFSLSFFAPSAFSESALVLDIKLVQAKTQFSAFFFFLSFFFFCFVCSIYL